MSGTRGSWVGSPNNTLIDGPAKIWPKSTAAAFISKVWTAVLVSEECFNQRIEMSSSEDPAMRLLSSLVGRPVEELILLSRRISIGDWPCLALMMIVVEL